MARDDGGPAFPLHLEWENRKGYSEAETYYGVSARDFFAAHALIGLIGKVTDRGLRSQDLCDVLAVDSYRIADAMLAQREERRSPTPRAESGAEKGVGE